MGRDIMNIGRHNLDISSREALAKDIAQRFKVNVRIVYEDHNSKLLEDIEDTFDTIIIDEIKTKGATKTFILNDEHYQLKEYYKLHGDAIFKIIEKQHNYYGLDELKEIVNGIFYYLILQEESDDGKIEKEYINIYQDLLHLSTCYYSRWWAFCMVLNNENTFDKDFKILNDYRRTLKKQLHIMGGHEMLYIDDQGELSNMVYGEFSWKDIMNELDKNYIGKVLSVSDFMRNPVPSNSSQYPYAFYDDFNDLE